MPSAFVFDLDGTLANTAASAGGFRTPAMLLRDCPPDRPLAPSTATVLGFPDGRSRDPGVLIARGYRVAIVTDSPLPYASTLCALLDIDYERLLAGRLEFPGEDSKRDKLLHLAEEWGLPVGEILYIGDLETDRRAAHTAGTGFELASQAVSSHLEASSSIGSQGVSDVLDPARNPPGPPPEAPQAASTLRCPWRSCGLVLIPALVTRLGKCIHCGRPVSLPEGGRAPSGISGLTELAATVGRGGSLGDDVLSVLGWNERSAPECVAAISAALLSSEPGNPSRRYLQRLLFKSIDWSASKCLIDFNLDEARFQFLPQLVTRSELAEDESLRDEVARAAARVFRIRSPNHLYLEGTRYRSMSIWPYWAGQYGDSLWKKLKHWRSFHSGPNVHQSLGHMVALAMAGHCRDLAKDHANPFIVPAPASEFTNARPGQFSERLGHWIAYYADLPCADILVKAPHGSIDVIGPLPRGTPILIDDQRTDGVTLSTSARALSVRGRPQGVAITWSFSHPRRRAVEPGCWFREHLGTDTDQLPCTCQA
jgi:hypothetical protein